MDGDTPHQAEPGVFAVHPNDLHQNADVIDSVEVGAEDGSPAQAPSAPAAGEEGPGPHDE